MTRTTIASIAILALAAAHPAFACACRPHSIGDDVEGAKQIYVARVVSAKEITPHDSNRYPSVLATLVVVESLKGEVEVGSTREVEFTHPCGVDVVISSSYVVFEHSPNATGRCDGTTRLTRENPAEDEKFVGEVRRLARQRGGG